MGESKRPIMLVCGHCSHHDLDGDELLEIDFKKSMMMYVCRKCEKENIIKLNVVPHSYPSIGVQKT
jgi:hypothetical protein